MSSSKKGRGGEIFAMAVGVTLVENATPWSKTRAWLHSNRRGHSLSRQSYYGVGIRLTNYLETCIQCFILSKLKPIGIFWGSNMTITIASGDLLKQTDVDAIVNTVNCIGVMGKGIALQFKKKWPANFKSLCSCLQKRAGASGVNVCL